jgi:TP901 family phage tail tape measure protein
VANNVKVIVEGQNNTQKTFNDVRGGMDSLQGAAGNLRTKALDPLNKALGTGLKVAGGAAVAALGALTVAVGSGVKAAMNMEQQIADIASVMNLAAGETAPLKNLIQDLGMDPKLKVSATEAADAIEMLGRNGVELKDILGGTARATVLLANATNADFGDAADIATDAMALFNIEAENMATAVNGIASVTTSSKFGINDYKLALAQAGGVAAVSGVEFNDFNATIAAISPYFASGSDAGTSFKTMLQRLIPQSEEAEGIMKELGLMTINYDEAAQSLARGLGREVQPNIMDVMSAFEELNQKTQNGKAKYGEFIAQFKENQFYDQTTGKMKNMEDVIELLNGAFSGLTEEQKNHALSTLFGTDAMRAAAAMAEMTKGEYIELKGTMGDVSAETMAATRMNTFSGVLEILGGVVDTLKMQIGDAFLPVLRRLAELFTEQAQIHGPRLVTAFQNLAGQLEVALNRFIPWVQQALPKMIEQIPTIIANLVTFGRQMLDAATTVYNAVAPVISFVAKLTDLKGILTTVGVLAGISVVAQVVTFVSGIVSAVSAVLSFVGALTGTGAILTTVTGAIGAILGPVGLVAAAVAGLYVAWKNNWFGIQDLTKQVFDWLRSTFANFPNTLASAGEAFRSWASSAMGKLREGFEAGKDAARNAIDRVLDYVKGANFGSFSQTMFDGANAVVRRLGEGFGASREFAKAQIKQVMADVESQGAAYAGGAFAGRMYDGAKYAMQRFGEGLRSSSFDEDMRRALNGMINAFNGTMDSFRNHVWGVAADVGDRIKNGLAGANLWNAMTSNLNHLVNAFNGTMDSFRAHVWGVMEGIGRRIADGLADGIRNGINNVINALNWITDTMPQWVRNSLGIHSPSRVFADIGQNINAGLAQGLNESMALPQAAIASTTNSLVNTTTVNQQRTWNFNVNQGGGGTGNNVQDVRMLSMLYGT